MEFATKIDHGQAITGSSGVKWSVDFLVEGSLVVEATTQKRLITKFNEVFMKFIDIQKAHPGYRCALVVVQLYRRNSYRRDKHYSTFPVAQYLALIKHGFPVLLLCDVPNLALWMSEKRDAFSVSSKPLGNKRINALVNTIQGGDRVLDFLQTTPMKESELRAKMQGMSKGNMQHIMGFLVRDGRVAKVGVLYGLSSDQILEYLAGHKRSGGTYRREEVYSWVRSRVLSSLKGGWKSGAELRLGLGMSSIQGDWFLSRMRQDGLVSRSRRSGRHGWVVSDKAKMTTSTGSA